MHEYQSERQSEQHCEYRLLRQYVERGCQAAFGQLVSRYSGLVYSTCLRQVGSRGWPRTLPSPSFFYSR